MKKIFYLGILFFIATACTSSMSVANKEEKTAVVKNLVDTQNFVFQATTVSPSGMSTKQLTEFYTLEVNNDSVIAYLPYFGKSYSTYNLANVGEEGGIKFTSTDFDYMVKENKKGWDVSIKINDNLRHAYQLTLSVTKSGSATLDVYDNIRQSISFRGYIEALK